MFDPKFAIFDIPVHEATRIIAIVCVILKVCSLIGGFLRGCINKNVCEIFCGPIISAIAIIPSALLWYVTFLNSLETNNPTQDWERELHSLDVLALGDFQCDFHHHFTSLCDIHPLLSINIRKLGSKLIIFLFNQLPCACCIFIAETFGISRRYNINEANRLNEQGGVAQPDENGNFKK